MSVPYVTFIICHADLAEALLGTVEKIIGRQEFTYTLSNQTEDLSQLALKIKNRLEEVKQKQPVFFVDLKGGSCWALASRICKENPKAVMISGVNLPMLLSYYNNLNQLSQAQLIDKLVEDGCRGISRQ